ncbi:MAG: hypothetical protein II802_02485 [Clostridia bacterium]|nr:hypothetical protein [Clostridia bacterium]
MDGNDFFKQQQEAMKRMMEMSSRAKADDTSHNMPPMPPFVSINGSNTAEHQKAEQDSNPKGNEDRVNKNKFPFISGNLGIPFLDSITKDADISLIIGIMLIFLSEKSDKLLLMALAYILM